MSLPASEVKINSKKFDQTRNNLTVDSISKKRLLRSIPQTNLEKECNFGEVYASSGKMSGPS